jgi:hypothetical protein
MYEARPAFDPVNAIPSLGRLPNASTFSPSVGSSAASATSDIALVIGSDDDLTVTA